jgi:hypothetical protein
MQVHDAAMSSILYLTQMKFKILRCEEVHAVMLIGLSPALNQRELGLVCPSLEVGS